MDWLLGIPQSFCLKRKFCHFLQSQIFFFGSTFFWAGAWNLFDIYLWDSSWKRDLIYGVVTMILIFIFEAVLSRESLIWLMMDNTKPITSVNQSEDKNEDGDEVHLEDI
eukprot:TRINITY_DN5643_c0_g1_i2.p1 TRINITY_DN5643_c0_g1~~TRINITY_DN5643_c0_g1_i2.p1  ORF type:complete len:109 (-),score=18.70 TRINITY_DN5643_c0_g1_i2:55-381(-)